MSKGPTKEIWVRSFIILFFVFFIGFGATALSLANIMLVKSDKYRGLAEEQQLRDVVTKARRGNIYDANLNVLATSATVWQTYITPSSIEKKDCEPIAKGLSELLEMENEKVYKITQKKTGYENVGKPVDIEVATKIRKFISENKYGSVIGLDETTKRYYANDNLASTVLGFVGVDNQGLSGIEYQYEEKLTGTPGRVVSAKNAKGADLPFRYEKVIDPKAGNSLVLTIDEYIQHVVEKYLDQSAKANGVQNRGCAVAMNVKTGEILAMATKPDFNPNQPFTIYDEDAAEAISKLIGDERAKEVSKQQQEQWRNKCVSDIYEPGSVFKIITGSAALDEGTLKTNETFHCPGYIKIATEKIRCHKTTGHGTQNLAEAFATSCNPAFISIGQSLGIKAFTDYRKAFGLQDLTGVDLPGESTPIYHQPNSMGPVELASESFGQTFKISPIQLVTAISAAVNGGNLYKPYVVKQVLDASGNIIENREPSLVRQVISKETSELICGYLEGVVKNGSGRNSYVSGFRVGGKTGTSQKIDKKSAEGKITKFIASFCAIAPSDDPEIAILMLLDEPDVPNVYGGMLVAPYVGKMIEEILPYLNITPEYTDEEAEKLEAKVPDIMGKKTKEAKNTITNAGLKYNLIGNGDSVVRQVPNPSSTMPKGGTVVIYTDNEDKKKSTTVPDFNGMTAYQANQAAVNAGLNIRFGGTTNNATAYNQSVEPGMEVEIGTVITVEFRETVVVE